MKQATTKAEMAQAVMDDIESLREANNCARIVLVWCGSTERYLEASAVHQALDAMQIKVNFLCRDSILAAPLVLDLALFGNLAKRAGIAGVQE